MPVAAEPAIRWDVKPPGYVTTFYSYKGGVGRTFLMANVAWLLARWGRKVLCVDWDLEAPGLHHYLAPLAPPGPGVLDLITRLKKRAPVRAALWNDLTLPIEGPWPAGGSLTMIRAGRQDEAYRAELLKLDWSKLAKAGLHQRIEEVRAAWTDPKAGYDHVLIDSRTGITDIAGLCAAQLPDLLVLAFTATHQSLQGAVEVAGLAAGVRAGLPIDRGPFDVLTVPCRIHTGEEEELEAEWSRRFVAVAGPLMEPSVSRKVPISTYLAHLRIREQARWSYGEHLPVATESLDDPARVSFSLANVALMVATQLTRSADLVERRPELLRQVAGNQHALDAAALPASSVFISYPWQAKAAARDLQAQLEGAGVAVLSDRDLPAGQEISRTLYEARERAAVHVILLSQEPRGNAQELELTHYERLANRTGTSLIPVFLEEGAWKTSPPFLRDRFGLFIDGEAPAESWNQVVKQIVQATRHRQA
jgi:MinD-like ATPase involved in chromosome partitioning or flagellar assembly